MDRTCVLPLSFILPIPDADGVNEVLTLGGRGAVGGHPHHPSIIEGSEVAEKVRVEYVRPEGGPFGFLVKVSEGLAQFYAKFKAGDTLGRLLGLEMLVLFQMGDVVGEGDLLTAFPTVEGPE